MLKPQKAQFRAGISPNEMIQDNSVSLTSFVIFNANYDGLYFAFGPYK